MKNLMMQKKSKLSFFALVLLIVSAVDSNRNLPSAAIFGSPLIFFFLFSAVFFLFPVSLISAELGAGSPRSAGVYHWVRLAFGEKIGMIAIWLQWTQAVAWYPTILSFLAGTGAFLFRPELIYSKLYMFVVITGIFWILTLVNLRGIKVSAQVNEFCCLIGTLFPMIVLIVCAILWLVKGKPLEISFSLSSIIPSLDKFSEWSILVAVMTSFSGMELAGVHLTSVENPRKIFPRALILASFIVLATMLFGSLAIAIVLPSSYIHLAGGLMQVFSAFFAVFHLDAWVFVISLMIVTGSLGNLVNWILSPAKGLLQASEYGYLPNYFAHVNKQGAASRILIAQAVLVTFSCSLFLFLPSVNAFYWFLMAISSCIYMVMYVLMFCAAIKLRRETSSGAFQVPFGKFGFYLACTLGIIGTLITIVVGFVPPPGIPIASPLKYALMIACGNIILICPVFYLFYLKKKQRKMH